MISSVKTFSRGSKKCSWMETLFFLNKLVQKNCLVFRVHLFKKQLNNQIAAVIVTVVRVFHSKVSQDRLFACANWHKKLIVNEDYWASCHDDKICFWPKCRDFISLSGDIEILLQKRASFHQLIFALSIYAFWKAVHWQMHGRQRTSREQVIFDRKKERCTGCAGSLDKEHRRKVIYLARTNRQNERKPVDQSVQKELNKLSRLNLKRHRINCRKFSRWLR